MSEADILLGSGILKAEGTQKTRYGEGLPSSSG